MSVRSDPQGSAIPREAVACATQVPRGLVPAQGWGACAPQYAVPAVPTGMPLAPNALCRNRWAASFRRRRGHPLCLSCAAVAAFRA
eukprot:8203472-Pyramimonas_sp.AAC.1